MTAVTPHGSAAAAEFNGLIEPHRMIKVGSPQAGVLATVEVERGDYVRAGQALATLDSRVEKATMEVSKVRADMEATISLKQANLEFFDRKKDRAERLFDRRVIAPSELDETTTNRDLADMQLKEAKENKQLAEAEHKRSVEIVNRLTIRSPVNGVVVERYLSPGEYLEDQPVVKLAQIDPLNVEVILPKALFLSVKAGMHAQVLPEEPIGGKYAAVVKIVDRVIDAASGTFGVRLELPNPGQRLPAGLKCKVIFPIK
jgi:RND family efflux transporter MFP subunit